MVHLLLLLVLALTLNGDAGHATDSDPVVLYVGTYTRDEGWVHGAG